MPHGGAALLRLRRYPYAAQSSSAQPALRRNPPFVHPFQSMYLEVDDLAQETTFCPQELPMTTSCNAQQCGQKLFEIAYDYCKFWFHGDKTLFLALSHLLLGTYFERDGQGVDCGAAQVEHYRFERCRFSSGAEPCHCVAAGIVTVHPWKCSFINISAPLWSRTYCLLGYIKLKMITESNRVFKSRHLKIKSAIVQNPSDICKKTGNCTESIFRIDCNAMLGAFISFFFRMQVTDLNVPMYYKYFLWCITWSMIMHTNLEF